MTSRKLFLLTLVLAIGAVTAQAGTVYPGNRECKGPFYFNSSVQAFGQARDNYGYPATAYFTVKFAQVVYGELPDIYTQDGSSFFFQPFPFQAGYYKVCARNKGFAPFNVDLQLNGY